MPAQHRARCPCHGKRLCRSHCALVRRRLLVMPCAHECWQCREAAPPLERITVKCECGRQVRTLLHAVMPQAEQHRSLLDGALSFLRCPTSSLPACTAWHLLKAGCKSVRALDSAPLAHTRALGVYARLVCMQVLSVAARPGQRVQAPRCDAECRRIQRQNRLADAFGVDDSNHVPWVDRTKCAVCHSHLFWDCRPVWATAACQMAGYDLSPCCCTSEHTFCGDVHSGH